MEAQNCLPLLDLIIFILEPFDGVGFQSPINHVSLELQKEWCRATVGTNIFSLANRKLVCNCTTNAVQSHLESRGFNVRALGARSKLLSKSNADSNTIGVDEEQRTPLQKYLEKQKEKRREPKQAARGAKQNNTPKDDDLEEEEEDDSEDGGMYEVDPRGGGRRRRMRRMVMMMMGVDIRWSRTKGWWWRVG